jgi:PAS domain S-box-containing protein
MDPPLRVLHLEDDVRDTELLQATLEAEGIRSELTRVETEQDFISALKGGSFDLILADYTLPDFDGVSALKLAQEHAPDVPFLFVSGTLGEDVAIESLKKGATDYVLKTRLARLGPSVTRALREARERTERKRAEEAVRRSEKELRDLIGTIPAMAFVTRADGSNEFVSRQWIDFSGLSGEQSRGSGWAATLHPEDREQHLAKWQAAQASGQPFESEARHRDARGNYRWLLVRAIPLRSEQGNSLKWYGTAIDIEDRKRAEEALRASEQLARSHVEVMMRSLDVLATEAAPEKFIAEMLRTIGKSLHARSVLLWLRDPEDGSLHLRLVIEDGRQVPPHQDHPFVKDPHSWERILPFQEMFFTKRPVVCDDLEQDSRIGAELREYMVKRGRTRFLAIPISVLGKVRGFIGIQHVERGAYRPDEVELAQALAHHVMIATHEAELGEQRRHAVLLEERTRMARDIHDTLAQGFMGVIIQLDTAVEALKDEEPEPAAKHIRRARELALQSLTEARRSVHALRPQALEEASFPDALKAIITNTTAGTSLQSDFQLKGEPRKLQSSVEENLLHIGQEALANALKHARATKFQARLSFDSEAVRLELCDNGQGFVVDYVNGRGIGLIGMKERAQQIGATLAVTSKPGEGTTIVAVSAYPAAVMT